MSTAKKPWFKLDRIFSAAGGQDRLARSVRSSLYVFGIVSVGYIGSTYLVTRTLEREARTNSLASAVGDFNADLLQMRRNEKDFLDRKTKDEVDKHRANYEKALSRLREAQDNPEANEEDQKTLDALLKDVQTYRKAFEEAVEQRIRLGVNENTGLQGSLRNAVHDAEELILGSGQLDLEASMLTLRRHEKDFILRERDEYIERHAKEYADFLKKLRNARVDAARRARIGELMQVYDREFQQFTAGTKALNASVGKAREAAHSAEAPVEPFVGAMAARAAATATATRRNLYLTSVAILAAMASVGVMLVYARRAADAALAEQRQARLNAEAENEALNNSVISILQSVHQLSQRDLTVKAPVTQDVVGTVSDSINALTEETAKVLRGVTEIAGQLERVSNKVKGQADMVSQTADDERKSVERMVSSLSDATQTMNQMATLAEQSNKSAEQATQVTEVALDTVQGTVKGMESIRETIAETEKRIKRLGERSQEITGIVNLINTISERTHVLALNASMQAAVAGEAGRGFGVVAEEVQRLAESSRNATQQIATLVNNIQLETNETIATVNRTIGQVVEGSEQAQKAGEQMRRTQQITAQLVGQVQRIASASEDQKAVSAQLLNAVRNIGQSTERTAEQIQAQNRETDTLLLSARQLVQSVGVFKLPQAT